MNNRIYFKGNPFPKGHIIKAFRWSGRLDPGRGLFFDFYLETNDYNEEDRSEDTAEDLPDWQSKAVWNNYRKCTLASKEKQQEGILVAGPGEIFRFDQWTTRTFTADTLLLKADVDTEDLAFGIYLLGHDSCAGHRITIEQLPDGLFNIHWTGRVALTYAGESGFDHEFEIFIHAISFDGIYYPQSLMQEEAMQLLAAITTDTQRFRFADLNPKSFKREYKLVLQP